MSQIAFFDADGTELHYWEFQDIIYASRVFDHVADGYDQGPDGWQYAELWNRNRLQRTITNA